MTQLAQIVKARREAGQKGLIVYLTAGYPNYDTTMEAVLAAAEAGADVVEIGMPFSDPMADGPVIQQAATEALKAGATTAKTLEMIAKIHAVSPIPLVVMTYVNTVLQYGTQQFARDFAAAGICGLIVPDLPMEESELLEQDCWDAGLDLVFFTAPTSTAERITAISKKASGFIYCVSNTGVTGVRDIDYHPIGEVIRKVRQHTDVPCAIGFGIGSALSACAAAEYADAVIVGSALIERLTAEGADGVRDFVGSLRSALDQARI